jgi:uncharacterized protein YacL
MLAKTEKIKTKLHRRNKVIKKDKVAVVLSLIALFPGTIIIDEIGFKFFAAVTITVTIVLCYWGFRFITMPKSKVKNSILELEKMAKLKNDGHITQNEFDIFKNQVLENKEKT